MPVDEIAGCIQSPEGFGRSVRARLGLPPGADLRVSYVPGPGDVAGTFRHWLARKQDPRVPIITYSLMFYELMDRLTARAQVLSTPECPSDLCGGLDIRFEQVARRAAGGRLAQFTNERRFIRQLGARIDAFDPHVLLLSSDVPSPAWPVLSKPGRRMVLSVHNSFWPMGPPPAGIWQKARTLQLKRRARALDGAVSTSPECARQLAMLTDSRISAPAEIPQIAGSHQARGRQTVQHLLYLGRIERNKGVFLLLDAFETLAREYPALSLAFAGTGAATDQLRRRISESRRPRIRFLGQLDSAQVHKALDRSDLLICPTMRDFKEGLAAVGFEAAAHGVPSVGSSIVPAMELLCGSCTVFEADDATALESAIARLLEDPARYRQLCAETAPVRAMTRDRSRSWGSCLARVLTQI